MNIRQTEQTAALYYRVANHTQTDGLNLDNQMQQLLCYARKRGLNSFTLYADSGFSGLALDRPAFNALKADIKAGRVGTVIVYDVARIGRGYALTSAFIEWAQKRGVTIASVRDGELTASPFGDFTALYRSLLKGGGRI